MRQLIPIAMTLLLTLFVFAACSDDIVTPDSSEAMEKARKDLYDPPPGLDPFMLALAANFDDHIWVEVPVELPVLMGGTVTVVPDGYPETHAIEITIEANPQADKTLAESTLWLAFPYPGEEIIDVPGNCIIYRTHNIPPFGTETAIISLPIMPWYETSTFSRNFTAYDLLLNSEGYPAPFEVQELTIDWRPHADPDTAIYMEFEANPDKDKPDAILDRVLDPDLPGDDDQD